MSPPPILGRGRRLWAVGGALLALSCSRPEAKVVQLPEHAPAAPPRRDEPPVAINPDVPVGYPEELYAQGIEGRVLLALYADSAGQVVPESTHVAESSGYPAFDSAALAAVGRFRFAPGRRNGVPAAMRFNQPIIFRHPQRSGVTP